MPLVLFIGLVFMPVVLLVLLRINAALVFLSLCLGSVLVQFVGNDAASVVAGASANAHATGINVKLILLVLPALMTMLFMIKSVKQSGKLLNILPAVGVGCLTALLVVPYLPASTASAIRTSQLWVQTESLQSAIMAGSALICLLFLLMQRPKHAEDKHAKKH